MFIELHTIKREVPILVNMDTVINMMTTYDGLTIWYSNGDYLAVTETYEEVKEMVMS